MASLALSAGVATGLYVAAPVDDLRGTIVYRPVGASTSRQAGLGVANVALGDVPDTLLLALLMNEDKTFVEHHGFDLEELRISIQDWIKGTRRLRGASTLTQQLARTVFLDTSRTLRRKLTEAIYALKLERRFAKDEILLLYVNNVEWGPDVYGIAAAAAHYFHKQPTELTPAECVFLVAILPNPVRLAARVHDGRLPRRTRFTMSRLTAAIHGATEASAPDPSVTRLVAAVRKLKERGDARHPTS